MSTPWYKKRQVVGLAAAILVGGAIVAGVFGSRAKGAHSQAPATEAMNIKLDTQPGEIQSVLDALVGGKAAEPAADASPASPVVTPVTPVTPQKPASTSGTFTDLTMPAGAGQALADALIPDIKDEDAAAIDKHITEMQNQLSASFLQQQQVATKTMAEVLAVSGAAFCYPKNGEELHDAIEDSKCTIIALNGGKYDFKKQVVINRTVVIIGNPINLPYLDGSSNERLFHVVAGGFLEIRYLRVERGKGRTIQRPPPLRPLDLRLGTVALVELGGRFTASGCVFETKPQTVESFINELERSFTHARLSTGGFIAVMGGVVDIIGCSFLRFRPLGNPSWSEVNIGRDILMIAGTINITGVFYFSMQLFHLKNSAGGIYGVMGGNLIMTGYALTSITGFNSQWGTGLQTYVGGGNMILTGMDRFSASVCLSRGGFGLFSVSAGNLVVSGFEQMSARGVSADFGTANWSVGAGTLTSVGTGLFSAHISRTAHIAGGYWFVGAGVVTIVGQVRNNMGTSTNQNGIGFHVCNVAGVSHGIFMTSYTAAMARCQIGAGTEIFMSAGFVTYVRVMRYRNIGAAVFIGKGNQIYVNRGAGVFIGNRQAAAIIIDWRTTRNVYTIGGQGTGRAGANTNLYIDSTGRYPLGEQTFNFPPPGSAFNKTKYNEWKASLPPKRKLVQASHLPLFRKLQEEDAAQNNNADLLFPRSFLIAVDDKYYEGQLVVPDEMDILAAQNELDENSPPVLAFFKAVQNNSPLDLSHNVLQISADNTDCLACDVPADQLVGETPCVASDQCKGKNLYEVLNLEETPPGLKAFADDMGWADLDLANNVDLTKPVFGELFAEDVEVVEDADAVVEIAHHDPVLRALQAAGVETPKKLPDVAVFEGEFAVYCKPAAAPAEGESKCGVNYQNARAALAYAMGDTTGESKHFSVSAWDKQLATKASTFADLFDLSNVLAALEPAALEGVPDAQSTVFGFTITTKDESQKQVIANKLAALAEDASPVLEKVDWLDNSETKYLDIKFSRKSPITVPGFPLGVKSADLFSGSIAPGVVVKADNSYGGIHTGTPGEMYELALANFPAGNNVDVKLIDTATGETVANQSATSVPVKLTKPGGVTSVAWTLPQNLEPGEYLVEASLPKLPAFNAQTMPFKVVA